VIDDSSTKIRGSDAACAAIIGFVVLLMGLPGLSEGGLGWSDAPQHAFDGVFVLEFLKDLPLDHARRWAERFYLRHPALGIIVYYPPGFAIVEGAVFAVLGVSVFTARLTVLLLAMSAALLLYALGRRWFDRPTGLFAALLLATCPHGVRWMRDVMLEWPATFWILAALWCYQRDRDSARPRWSVATGGAMVAAFLTKQTAGFVLPLVVLHAAWMDLRARRRPEGGRAYLSRPIVRINLGAAALIIAGYLVLTRPYAALPATLLRPALDFSGVSNWPVEILGWPLLPVAALGLVTLLAGGPNDSRPLLLPWFFGWTGFSLLISAKEPRYMFFALPPLLLAAPRLGLRRAERDRSISWAGNAPRIVLLAALVALQAGLALRQQTDRLPTYAAAVAELAGRPDADIVLVDAVRDGQFIFDAYVNPAARDRLIPLRASKLLYARAARERYGYQQFVQSPRDILDLLNRYGIRYIVVESALPATPYVEADPPPRKMLRELLATDERFELAKSWPLKCGDPAWESVELRIYAYPACPPRSEKTIRLPFPSMNQELEITLP